MPRALKVYGWQGWRPEAPGSRPETREIVAATSMREAARIAGAKGPHALFNLSETGNDAEIATAMAEPRVIFWLGSDERPHDGWHRDDASATR